MKRTTQQFLNFVDATTNYGLTSVSSTSLFGMFCDRKGFNQFDRNKLLSHLQGLGIL